MEVIRQVDIRIKALNKRLEEKDWKLGRKHDDWIDIVIEHAVLCNKKNMLLWALGEDQEEIKNYKYR